MNGFYFFITMTDSNGNTLAVQAPSDDGGLTLQKYQETDEYQLWSVQAGSTAESGVSGLFLVNLGNSLAVMDNGPQQQLTMSTLSNRGPEASPWSLTALNQQGSYRIFSASAPAYSWNDWSGDVAPNDQIRLNDDQNSNSAWNLQFSEVAVKTEG